MNQDLYILLNKEKETDILEELYKKQEITFIKGPRDFSRWRYNSRQKLANQRKFLNPIEKKRPIWCLKHLHDKMFDMRM